MPLNYTWSVGHENWETQNFYEFLAQHGPDCMDDVTEKERDALAELWADYRRIKNDTAELCRLRPERAESYHAQCKDAWAVIEKQILALKIPGIRKT